MLSLHDESRWLVRGGVYVIDVKKEKAKRTIDYAQMLCNAMISNSPMTTSITMSLAVRRRHGLNTTHGGTHLVMICHAWQPLALILGWRRLGENPGGGGGKNPRVTLANIFFLFLPFLSNDIIGQQHRT